MMKTLRTNLISFKSLMLSLLMAAVIFSFSSFNDYTESDVQVKEVKCYPNPATSVINFDFQKNIDRTYVLQIYSFSGRKMSETSVSASTLSINLNDYFRGIYLFQLRDKEGNVVESGKFQVVK